MSPDAACHELLVRLAGRLPDRLLWRLREWLATGADAVVAATLPRALLRHRVGLTDAERDLLEIAVADRGAPRRVLDAILTVTVPDEPEPLFRPADDLDAATLSLLAVTRGDDGCVELRQALRIDGRREQQRVVLARTTGRRPWVLAATLGRLLRAHGDREPCVEVLTTGEPTAYHRAALTGSTLLWRSPDRVAVPTG